MLFDSWVSISLNVNVISNQRKFFSDYRIKCCLGNCLHFSSQLLAVGPVQMWKNTSTRRNNESCLKNLICIFCIILNQTNHIIPACKGVWDPWMSQTLTGTTEIGMCFYVSQTMTIPDRQFAEDLYQMFRPKWFCLIHIPLKQNCLSPGNSLKIYGYKYHVCPFSEPNNFQISLHLFIHLFVGFLYCPSGHKATLPFTASLYFIWNKLVDWGGRIWPAPL